MMRRSIAYSVSLLVLCGLAYACTEKELMVEPVAVRRLSVIAPPGVSGLDLPVGGPNDPANSLSLPTYDYPVIVQLRLEGTIATVSRPDTYLAAYSGGLDGSGIYVESVFSQCNANVTFRFSIQGTRGPGPCLFSPVTKSSWTDTSLVEGTGRVTRAQGIPQFTGDCNNQPCHSYSGTQTVFVTPLPATLQLAASASQVDSGQTVVFTASASPSSIKGLQVPVKVLSWRWVPSGGGTGQTIACSIPSNPCSAIIREYGAMELTALANGAEQVVSANVLLNGGLVKVVPDSSRMKFSVFVPSIPGYIPRNNPSTQKLTISVTRPDGTPIPNRTVTLELAASENTAGHLHSGNPPKPAGLLNGGATAQVNTGPTGMVHTVTFQAPEPSGPVTITGTSAGSTPGSASIDVGLFTLSAFGSGPGYTLIGSDTHGAKHPDSHYATPTHIVALQRLAGAYSTRFLSGLQYNDAGLQFGGLFDYDWETTPWQLPHAGHREGMHTDLRIRADVVNNLPELSGKQLRIVKKYWKDALGGTINIEGDHWHLVHP